MSPLTVSQTEAAALDFDSASSTAKEAYEAYRAAQKEFDNEYGWRRNPTSHGGYGAAYGELQELKQAYLESLDYLLDNYDSFETDAGIPPPDRDRDTLQGYMNQLTEHMWDYYHEDPEDVDPERIAMYIADIAALRNVMETAPLQVVAEETPAWQEYMKKSLNQIIKGNYTDDVTLAGTLGQIGLGVLGADFPADLRDITYDWTHLKTTPWYQTLLDTVAILPGIGAIKYADEGVELAKGANQAADAADNAVDLAKQGDEFADTVGDTGKIALDAAGNVGYSKIDSLEITQKVSPNEEGYEELLTDISENGITEPIKYVRVGNTCYVVDGHHRLYAAKQLGFDVVPTEEVMLPYQGYRTVADLFWWD